MENVQYIFVVKTLVCFIYKKNMQRNIQNVQYKNVWHCALYIAYIFISGQRNSEWPCLTSNEFDRKAFNVWYLGICKKSCERILSACSWPTIF